MQGAAVVTGDRFGRPLRDLRLSVTDRCNFRCPYCMPRASFGSDHVFAPRAELLSFEELARLVEVFAGLGVTKVRLTGGEPLLRRGIETLVTMIARTPGITDLAMTTNGSLLAGRAEPLRAAGLARVTVSLDSVDPATFARMSDSRIPLGEVLEGIAAAQAAGLEPVKLNAVIRRGVNDDQVLELAEYARSRRLTLRFIEYMDVGDSNGWRPDEVVSGAQVRAMVAERYPLEPVESRFPGEVARRWRYADDAAEVGFITSVTEPFCGDCTRARVTATGEMFTCLFGAHGTDLRALLRRGASDDALREAIGAVWARRDDRYSEQRSAATAATRRGRAEMSYLGG